MLKFVEGSDCIVLSRKAYKQIQKLEKLPILGRYCFVRFSEAEFVCKIFCDSTLSCDYTLVGTQIRNILVWKPSIDISNLKIDIWNKTVLPAKCLTVSVILSNLKALNKWKKTVKKATVVQDLLFGISVSRNTFVTTKVSPLGKIHGIDYIHITGPSTELCKVGSTTDIEVNEVLVTDHALQNYEKKDVCISGLENEINVMSDIVITILRKYSSLTFWKGVLLWGPSGCGRNVVPEVLAKRYNLFLMKVTVDTISSSVVGETEQNLKTLFQYLKDYSRQNPVLLLIDDLDTVCPKRSSSSANQRRIAAQLISELDGICSDDKLFVMGSTTFPENLDAALRRPGRMDKEIYVGMPNSEARLELMKYFMCHYGLKFDPKLTIPALAETMVGYSRDDIERMIGFIASEERPGLEVTEADFSIALHQIRPSLTKTDVLGVAEHTKTKWEEVGGLERAKLSIKKAVEWPLKHPEAFERFGIPKPRGILLYGPPGCGKSLLVRAAATECAAAFITVKASEIFSSYVGESERIIVSLFKKARLMAPCILFLDELDSIVGSRENSANSKNVQQGVITSLLQEMDGITASASSVLSRQKVAEGFETHEKEPAQLSSVPTEGVILVGATNRPDKIDAALLRPGRLDTHVYVPPPDSSARLNVLKISTKNMPLDGVDLHVVAERTEGFSGADLKFLCKEVRKLKSANNPYSSDTNDADNPGRNSILIYPVASL